MAGPQKTPSSPADQEVEYYAGGRGEERPLAVVRAGRRLLVSEVKERKRIVDSATGVLRETFICRLENGEVVTVERDV
jgi:hypothetical protein